MTFMYLAVSGVNAVENSNNHFVILTAIKKTGSIEAVLALPCKHLDGLREVCVEVKEKWKALKLPPKKSLPLLLFSTVHPSLLSPHLFCCSAPSLWGHRTPWQFVLNLTMQMFLWVTDFYSLEKIISAFRKIVLLYLKMTGARNRRVWGQIDWERGKERKRNGCWTKGIWAVGRWRGLTPNSRCAF